MLHTDYKINEIVRDERGTTVKVTFFEGQLMDYFNQDKQFYQVVYKRGKLLRTVTETFKADVTEMDIRKHFNLLLKQDKVRTPIDEQKSPA